MFSITIETEHCKPFPPSFQEEAERLKEFNPTLPHSEEEMPSPLPESEERAASTPHQKVYAPSGFESQGSEADRFGVVMLLLANIYIDASIVPRAGQDEYTVQQYAAALIRGERLPAISVEATDSGYRVLKGILRYRAYLLRRDIYAEKYHGDFYDEPLPFVSDTELNTIPCIVETIPPDVHPMVFCMMDNLKHGKPLTPEDFRRVARQVYKDNEGAFIVGLAKLAHMDRRTFAKYVRDLEKAFEAKKKEMILELDAQGVSQTEIGRRFQERFPKAPGTDQSSVSDFLKKNRNLHTTDNETEQVPPVTTTVHSFSTSAVDTENDESSGNGSTEEEGAHPHSENETEPKSTSEETSPSEPSQESPRTIDLRAITGTSGDALMILGILSLPPTLQENLRKEAEELVDRIREEALNLLKQETESHDDSPDEPEQAPESPEDTEPEPRPVSEAKRPQPPRFRSVFHSPWGSKPVGYFS